MGAGGGPAEAGELGGTGVAGQAVQLRGGGAGAFMAQSTRWRYVACAPKKPPIRAPRAPEALMKILRRTLLVLVPMAALGLLAAGIASAQTPPPSPPQSGQDADKARSEADKRQDEAAKAEAARRAEARKPKRDKSRDGKDPERELEEEEDI
jgi:hypothetical protein